MNKRNNSIGIDALVFAAYVAITPIHQTLVLSNGSTVVKYAAFLLMIACVVQGYIVQKRFLIIKDLYWPVFLLLGWCSLSLLWTDSISATASNLVSTGSYFALMLIVGSRKWSDQEKRLLLIALILSCVYYSFNLIRASAITRRATLAFSILGDKKNADQNFLTCNIGIGALFAFYCFLIKKKGVVKWISFGLLLIMLTGMFSTGSRGGLLAFAVGAAYLLYKCSRADSAIRNMLPILVIAAFATTWLLFSRNILHNDYLIIRYSNSNINSLSDRFEIWKQYIGLLCHRPVGFFCGYGAGCDTLAHAAYMERDWLRASHNDILSLVCQFGIPGLILTGSFVRHIWRTAQTRAHYLGGACMITVLVGSLDINLFRTYGWWNAMLFAYIGIDDALQEQRVTLSFQETDTSSAVLK